MARLSTLVGVLVLAYGAVVALYALMQRSFIYYPQTASLEAAVAAVGRRGGSPWLDGEGQWLGWHMGPADASRRVLIMHGNAGQASDRDYWLRLFQGLDQSGPWAVYVLEYPGYGPRSGRPSEDSLRIAALRAMEQLQTRRAAPVLLLGESLGSGVAAHVAAALPEQVAGLLLVTPFHSLLAVARYHLPWLPVSLLLRDRYESRQLLADYAGPLVIVTAADDNIVPARLALPLKEAHRGPLLHWQQEGAGHNTLDLNPRASGWRDIDTFLARYLGPADALPPRESTVR